MERKFKSNYTDQLVTEAQYLTEFVMERIAKKEGKVLKWKFWNDPEWGKIFRRQITAANKILNEATLVSVVTFLRSKKGQNIYSLGLKKVILDGAVKVFCTEVIKSIEDDGFMSDFIPQENFSEKEINKPSLWSSLNG